MATWRFGMTAATAGSVDSAAIWSGEAVSDSALAEV